MIILSYTGMRFQSVNDRIIFTRFKGSPINISIMQVYAPMSEAAESKQENFYPHKVDIT